MFRISVSTLHTILHAQRRLRKRNLNRKVTHPRQVMVRHIHATKGNRVLATIGNRSRVTSHSLTRVLRNRTGVRVHTSHRKAITVNRINSSSIQRQANQLRNKTTIIIIDTVAIFNRHHQRGTNRHSNSKHRRYSRRISRFYKVITIARKVSFSSLPSHIIRRAIVSSTSIG